MSFKMSFKKKDQFGLSILEVVIATMLLMVVGFAMVIVFSLGLQQLTRAKTLTMATSLAQQKMEEVLAKAPGKLPTLSGTFSSKPDYNFNVSYSANPLLPALQTALVEIKGPLGTQVAFAQAVPAGSQYSNIASAIAFLGHVEITTSGVVDRYNQNMLHLKNLSYPFGHFQLQIGTGKQVSSLTLAVLSGSPFNSFPQEFGLFVLFFDKTSSPYNVCKIKLVGSRSTGVGRNSSIIYPCGFGNFRVEGNGIASTTCVNNNGPPVNVSALVCEPFSVFFSP